MGKRILIGSSSPPDRGSGINAYVNQLVAGLARDGHNLLYVAPASDQPDFRSELYEHIAIGQQQAPAAAARQLLEVLGAAPVDLIINNDNPYLQMIAPWVDSVFVSIGHMSRTSVARLACYNHAWTDYVVAISADMQRHFTTRFSVPTDRVPIVYNGVADPLDGQWAPRAVTPLQVIFAGGTDRNKGADLLLRALQHPRWRDGSYQLHWFGHMGATQRRRLERLPHVLVHGRVSREIFLQHLRKADVFLLPSRAEGCPMAMLEAMSYGVVPLASDGVGAMQRLIIHGTEGYICRRAHWADDMLDCLQRLRDNPQLRAALAGNAYRRFRSDFTVENTVQQLLSLANLPSVDRKLKPDYIRLLRWHRPTQQASSKAPLLDRFCIRAGLLRTAGTLFKEQA